jgi:hypothetical protein
MQVININERSTKKRKEDLLEVLDNLRSQIEEGQVDEFVISSIGIDGEVQIHVCVKDSLGGVGLFEIGKNILFQHQQISGYE